MRPRRPCSGSGRSVFAVPLWYKCSSFAREGAHVFLAGGSLAPLEAIARDIAGAEGVVETAQVDAFDEASVTQYLETVVRTAGKLDISFNAVSIPHEQGIPLVELGMEEVAGSIAQAMRTQFVTARAAARHMIKRGSGVILTITATPARARLNLIRPSSGSPLAVIS